VRRFDKKHADHQNISIDARRELFDARCLC
jgi:hypothetical protein